MARILIVDDSTFNLKIVIACLAPAGYELLTASTGREALERAVAAQPDLIILDVMLPDLSGYEVCRELRRNAVLAQRPIMMLTAQDALEQRINGLESGADDYMCKPFEAAELQARVKAMLRRTQSVSSDRKAHKRQGKVIATFSLRGGIGVSTIATNLAVGLTQIWGRPSALVDLALINGQSALMLNLPLRNSWADLGRAELSELDEGLLDSVLLSHASGTRVLAPPSRPEQSELITAEKVARVLSLLTEQYDYIVLDLPHDFSDTTLAGLDAAEQILLVLTPELAAVRAMSTALEVFTHLGYPRERLALILNTTFERGALARKDIEATLKQPIALTLPFASDTLISAINRGIPPVVDLATKPIAAALEDCAFFVSREADRTQRPAKPTEAWQRLAHRTQQRRLRAS